MHDEFYSLTEKLKNNNLKSLYGFGDAVTKLQTFAWIFNHVQESQLDPCSTLEHQTWSLTNLNMTFYMVGVSLSISSNLKLAPVPHATPKWLIIH